MARMTIALTESASEYVAAQSALIASPSHPQTLSRLLLERRDLHRLELRRVPLTAAEATVIASIMNGVILSPGVGSGVLYGELIDAFDIAADSGGTSYTDQYGINEDRLLTKIRGIGPSADLALREAFARWWAAEAAGEHGDRGDVVTFASVGLRIVPDPTAPVIPADFDAALPDSEPRDPGADAHPTQPTPPPERRAP